jgi:hypothetical protein
MRGKKVSVRIAVGLAVVASLTLFASRPVAAQVETVLDTFKNKYQEGESPDASLIFDQAGNLYGTTFVGGRYSQGTAFELTPNGHGGWNEHVLHNFGNVNERNKTARLPRARWYSIPPATSTAPRAWAAGVRTTA